MFSPEQLPVKTELVNEFGCALPLCVLAAVHCTSLLGQPAVHDKEATPLLAVTHSHSPPVSPRSPSMGKMRHRPQQQGRPPEIGNSGSRPNLAVELTANGAAPLRRLFNKYFTATPTASTPNHLFAQSATSCGQTGNSLYSTCGGKTQTYPQPTIYDNMRLNNVSFALCHLRDITCDHARNSGGLIEDCL
eukprot:COSAG01_NODE_10591_length_2116_cov_1.496300_3_plen_190_part_00